MAREITHESIRGNFDVDPYHDELISNPNLREAFNEATRQGYEGEEAHAYSHFVVFGPGEAERQFDEEIIEAVRDDAEAQLKGVGAPESNSIEKYAPDGIDYEKVDDALLRAHEKAVEWKVGERAEDIDLDKAPGIWGSQSEVPDWVLNSLESLIDSGNVVWSGGYSRLPPSAEAEVKRILEDRMTQPQGWSLSSLLDDLKDHYPNKSDDYLLNILRNETSAVLNTAREQAYVERDDDREYEYEWIGPTDHRTTDTCLEIAETVESEGGSVTLDRLKEILYEKAVEHSDREGTPERVDDWQPHYQCRRTFTRVVDL